MTVRTNLDMDVLRTFVTGFELGSFTRAADRLGRSQSAISTQLRKLEEQIGRPLVRRSGRGLAPTPAGEALLGYAKRLLELNDEAVRNVRGAEVEGWARLGLPQDLAESWLPAVLQAFSRAHPKVRIEVQVEQGARLAEKTLRGELDIALVWGDAEGSHVERVAELPMRWIARRDWPGAAPLDGGGLPFVAFGPPCAFRAAAVEALDAAGLPWRLAFTSYSLSGVWAAVEAGLGVTVRSTVAMPDGLAAVSSERLPTLPAVSLVLHRAEADPAPAVARLVDMLLAAIRDGAASGVSDLVHPSRSPNDDFQSSRCSTEGVVPT